MNIDNKDLLELPEQGGCSAKFGQDELSDLLSLLPVRTSDNILVGNDTLDDASVWKINDEVAIVQTTDFFPPICEDPYIFGQVAAANALSDIYAMGGKPITALNLVMYPEDDLRRDALKEMLSGGANKVFESGAVLSGGHTIKDVIVKYGLAVTGTVHPDRILTNDNALPGNKIILTKAIGSGVALSGNKLGLLDQTDYEKVLDSMIKLNDISSIIAEYDLYSATDVTGFGLIGHLNEVATASNVSIELEVDSIPLFDGILELAEDGCLPCALFKNLNTFEDKVEVGTQVKYSQKMLCYDAQTSGGLLLFCDDEIADSLISELHILGFENSSIIGDVVDKKSKNIYLN